MDNKIIYGEFDFGISSYKELMDFINPYIELGIEIMEYKKNGPAGGNFWMILSFPSLELYHKFIEKYDPDDYDSEEDHDFYLLKDYGK